MRVVRDNLGTMMMIWKKTMQRNWLWRYIRKEYEEIYSEEIRKKMQNLTMTHPTVNSSKKDEWPMFDQCQQIIQGSMIQM